MKFPPFTLPSVACAATLIVSQSHLPTVRALPSSASGYRVQVIQMRVARTVGGLMITGRVLNTGSKPLAYTKVMPTFADRSGKIIYTGSGYLTVSPLLPGRSAEFRACELNAPVFSQLHIAFREAGHPVLVTEQAVSFRQDAAANLESVVR